MNCEMKDVDLGDSIKLIYKEPNIPLLDYMLIRVIRL